MTLPGPPRRILLADHFRDALAEELRAMRPDLELRIRDRREVTRDDLRWADCYLGFRPPTEVELEHVTWVHGTGAGLDAFLFRRHFPADVLLTRTSESFGAKMGEYCLARMLAETQDLFAFEADQRARRWNTRDLRALTGTRALIVGTGDVGGGIASAIAALGVTVDGVSRSGALRAPFARTHRMEELPALAGGADWLVLAAPLTEATWHIAGAALFAACRGAYLINVGRGGLVDEPALLAAVEAGALRGAALDVFEAEPLPASSPLWAHPRIVISPHVSGLSTVAHAARGFLDALTALERGERPAMAVDVSRGY
ncbi:MAG TPA: D-2-hydroxyacid dehydrogenase [Gemmatimonadales bacterium]|nr:D-2-hydroxyacid dehydrogenase [Gemmatimonadales bacterium]